MNNRHITIIMLGILIARIVKRKATLGLRFDDTCNEDDEHDGDDVPQRRPIVPKPMAMLPVALSTSLMMPQGAWPRWWS